MENYFNYFTEIEEQFQRCRGTPALLSTLDWALIESWKEAQWPLPAVLAGIERAFEKYNARPRRGRRINGLAYCAQAVTEAVEQFSAGSSGAEKSFSDRKNEEAYSSQEILDFLVACTRALDEVVTRAEEKGIEELPTAVASLNRSLKELITAYQAKERIDTEELENRLSVLEQKLIAALTQASSDELLGGLRREVGNSLASYRGKMNGMQVAALEQQLLKKRLFEHYRLPRLSLFYL